ncbi:hypothetical protein BDW74DRAFT_181956 [Aspergillus multicolor]|uniref:uncharacterized protein n=1 Tax=Aspergillus multicolor TaxID=41759 RepID=UPI003CCE21DA
MSTLSSPRPSIASSRAHSPTPASSRRPSLDALNTSITGSLSAASTPSTARAVSPSLHPRRNRAALRDYYNLKPSDATTLGPNARSRSVPRHTDAGDISNPPNSVVTGTELDSPDFDPQRYVNNLLATSSLSTILKAENTLVGDIRTLDGERKALVYDNYSKLIRAVETIGKMRQSMDERGAPLTMTKTLGPAIAFVAETAGSLIREGEELRGRMKESNPTAEKEKQEKDTVRWALSAPGRLDRLVKDGKREEAERDWEEVSRLLAKWDGVKGVSEVREACEKVMRKEEEEAD